MMEVKPTVAPSTASLGTIQCNSPEAITCHLPLPLPSPPTSLVVAELLLLLMLYSLGWVLLFSPWFWLLRLWKRSLIKRRTWKPSLEKWRIYREVDDKGWKRGEGFDSKIHANLTRRGVFLMVIVMQAT